MQIKDWGLTASILLGLCANAQAEMSLMEDEELSDVTGQALILNQNFDVATSIQSTQVGLEASAKMHVSTGEVMLASDTLASSGADSAVFVQQMEFGNSKADPFTTDNPYMQIDMDESSGQRVFKEMRIGWETVSGDMNFANGIDAMSGNITATMQGTADQLVINGARQQDGLINGVANLDLNQLQSLSLQDVQGMYFSIVADDGTGKPGFNLVIPDQIPLGGGTVEAVTQ